MPKPLTVWIIKNCGKFLEKMRLPDHLTCLLRSLYAGQEAAVKTGCGTTDWFKIGKGVCQGCILSSCLFNSYAEYIMWNARLDEAQAGIKIAGRSINNLRYQHHPNGRKWKRKNRASWWRWKTLKVGLKLNIQKNEDHGTHSHYFLANRRGNNGNSKRLDFPGLQNHLGWWLQPWNEDTCSLEEKLWPT